MLSSSLYQQGLKCGFCYQKADFSGKLMSLKVRALRKAPSVPRCQINIQDLLKPWNCNAGTANHSENLQEDVFTAV